MDRTRWRYSLAVWLGLGAGILPAAEAPAPGAEAVQRLLEAAEQRGPAAVAEAKRRFEAARVAAEDERAVRYAYGVTLARLLKTKEAAAQFDAASATRQGLYPPAARAQIFLQLSTREWTAAARNVRALGEAFTQVPDAWDSDTAWLADARWLGAAVSTAQLLVATAHDVKTWSEIDETLRESLAADLKTHYVAGFEDVVQQHDRLTNQNDTAVQQAAIAEGEKNEVTRKEVEESQQKISAQKESLKATAQDWKKQFDEQMIEFGKELGKLEKDWTSLDTRRQSLERSILLVQQEITLLTQQIEQYSNSNSNNSSGNQASFGINFQQTFMQQLGQRQQALLQYQLDWNRTAVQQNQVQQQALRVVSQRGSAAADYQQRTGQLTQQDGQLDKWNSRLNKQVKDLDKSPTGTTAQTRSLQQKLKAASTYLPWDWEAERQRLLQQTAAAAVPSNSP